MLTIPVNPIPSQTLSVNLAGQPTRLFIEQKSTGLYITVTVNGVTIVSGVYCADQVKIVRDAYLGFTGDLVWVDTQGNADPYYNGLGARWALVYLP